MDTWMSFLKVAPICGASSFIARLICSHARGTSMHQMLPTFFFLKTGPWGEERIEEDDDLDPHPRDERLARSS